MKEEHVALFKKYIGGLIINTEDLQFLKIMETGDYCSIKDNYCVLTQKGITLMNNPPPPKDVRTKYIKYTSPYVPTVHEMVNVERVGNGVHSLLIDAGACRVAQAYAEKLSVYGNIQHKDPDTGYSVDHRLRSAGVSYKGCGENLAIEDQPEDCVEGWMRSPGHRGNILDSDYNCEGLGFSMGDKQWYCCQVFTVGGAGTPFEVEYITTINATPKDRFTDIM